VWRRPFSTNGTVRRRLAALQAVFETDWEKKSRKKVA